jgi:hypothetical protein
MLTRQLHKDQSSIWMCYQLERVGFDAFPIYSQSVPKNWRTVFANDWDMVGEHLLFFINLSLSHSATQYEATMKWRLLKFALMQLQVTNPEEIHRYSRLPELTLNIPLMFFQCDKWLEMLQEVKFWEQMEQSGVMKNVMAAELADIPMPPPPESQHRWVYATGTL